MILPDRYGYLCVRQGLLGETPLTDWQEPLPDDAIGWHCYQPKTTDRGRVVGYGYAGTYRRDGTRDDQLVSTYCAQYPEACYAE